MDIDFDSSQKDKNDKEIIRKQWDAVVEHTMRNKKRMKMINIHDLSKTEAASGTIKKDEEER